MSKELDEFRAAMLDSSTPLEGRVAMQAKAFPNTPSIYFGPK